MTRFRFIRYGLTSLAVIVLVSTPAVFLTFNKPGLPPALMTAEAASNRHRSRASREYTGLISSEDARPFRLRILQTEHKEVKAFSGDGIIAKVEVVNRSKFPVAFLDHPTLMTVEVRTADGKRVQDYSGGINYTHPSAKNLEIVQAASERIVTLYSRPLFRLKSGSHSIRIRLNAPYPKHIVDKIPKSRKDVDTILLSQSIESPVYTFIVK